MTFIEVILITLYHNMCTSKCYHTVMWLFTDVVACMELVLLFLIRWEMTNFQLLLHHAHWHLQRKLFTDRQGGPCYCL